MENDEEVQDLHPGQPFGQKEPPLTESIKSILGRYPDGGQILKELIQNADDAGATEVKFLYDGQSFKADFVASPELAKFQGPAFYAFNDATFKDEDWDGIQNLMNSNKKNDPLKVGSFGIGFNSVYHITDLPGIVSGNTIAFLDPHKKYFQEGVSGQRYEITSGLLEGNLQDQFKPFHDIFGCDLSHAVRYERTLFRFPLRTDPSELSKKEYTKEKVDNVLESLREEASVILLFLKSVQSISVHERKENGEVECVFKVEVAEDTREEVRRKRQEFLNNAKEPTITESRYIVSIQVTSASLAQNFRWLIVNQVGSNEERISELANELCLLPWIGMAVALDMETNDALDVETNNARSGRIFCFLPLPPDVDCETGLPVLVHGYFGVTDNRRGLLWPGTDCQNNPKAEWNELLVKKVAGVVYSKILDALVKDEPCTGLDEKQRRQLVYSALPELEKVKGHWRSILDPLFVDLVDQKFFHCQSACGSSWITLNEGILDQLVKNGIKPEIRNAILKTLLKNSHVVITDLPSHVSAIVEAYVRKRREVTPNFIRSFLKNPATKTMSREKNLLLLDYVLSDDPKTAELTDVPLLPLAHGGFAPFHAHCHSSDPSSSVFVPSGNCTMALLPNMANRFLDISLSEGTYKKLDNMAATEIDQENSTQLVKLTKEIVIENLRASLPAEWFSDGCDKVRWSPDQCGHPSENWLKDIWRWIDDSCQDSLAPFHRIPLIPLPPMPKRATKKYLGVLSEHSKFIFASDGSGNDLPTQVTSLLTASGCTVLFDPPSYLRHPDINSYIAPPTPAGATSVLSRASLQTVQQHIKLSTSDDRGILREFFSRLPESLCTDKRNFLLQLPLFDTLHGSCTAVQVNGHILNAASPEFSLPSGFNLRKSEQIISSADPKAHQLLTMLNVEILKPAAVFVRYLFPDIQAKCVYNLQETSTIMLWILHQMFNYNSQFEGFHEAMTALPFVSTDEGELKKPSELYDPNDALLLNLFLEEANKFPSEDFADGQVIPALTELGLRTRSMLTAGDLLGVAVSITSSPYSSSTIHKVHALVEILEGNLVYLNQHVDGYTSLKDKLLQMKWLPCAKTPPNIIRFPKYMPWFNSVTPFVAPVELRSKSHALLVGSSMPILDVNMDESLQKQLGLTSDPPIHQVVAQLKTAVQVWQQKDQKKATSQFHEMLVAIYLNLSKKSKESVSIAINSACLSQWIWHGTGFCSPTQVALEKDFPVDLRPQLFLLPKELNDRALLTDFFFQHGVRQKFSEEDIISVLPAVREKHTSSLPQAITSKEIESDLKLCRSILEWLVEDGKTLSESLQEKVLVPVQSSKDKLVLEPCKNCTYCDRVWLRRGGSELDIPGDYQLIHESVPTKAAKLLGVPALSTCLLSAETLGFEQTGPYEPLTTRLSNILKEYKEGVGVFKELIQNADDAGASKVRFLVDWRRGPKKTLLSPGMVDCQGPALWAYNNSVFTDKDFENINKLAGATKVDDLAKIGRFGLGFNAVYHLTDVPSFVSREHVVIFDPNTNHLESHIHDKSRPGIRINLASNPRPLSAFADQFKLYHDVFGCKTQGIEGKIFNYDGTLFRFPFRTSNEAKKSEISQSVYDKAKVKGIVRTLKQNASLLLLYTQHVNVVELYEVGNKGSPRAMKLLLSITKREPESSPAKGVSNHLPFIEECSDWWRKRLASSNVSEVGLSRSEHLTIEVKQMASDLTGTVDETVKTDSWLLTSCVGKDTSVELASSQEGQKHGLLPCAGSAAKISGVPENSRTISLCAEQVKGEAFCFLPLSIPTGFPVHVNGSFAVRSNRDGIWEKNTDGVQIESQWNESLLQDASSEAYVQLLQDMKSLSEAGRLVGYAEDFHLLWPNYESLKSSIWETLVKSVYAKIVNLPLLWSNGKWLDIGSGHILHEDLSNVPRIIETLQSLGEDVFEIPSTVMKALEKSGLSDVVKKRTLTMESFFKDLFFPNLPEIAQELRDPIVCCGLDRILEGHDELESLYKKYSCITCSSDGLRLTTPCNLINPKASVASLFSAEDCRFPVGEHFQTENRLIVLERLGMVKDLLSWSEICGRAKSVEKLIYERGLQRSRNLIKYLKENIERLQEKEAAGDVHLGILQKTKFLPLLRKPPKGYTLPWKGTQYDEIFQFFSPKHLFLSRDVHLVGSCGFIVDETDVNGCGKLGKRLEVLLGFDQRKPLDVQVLKQLDFAINEEAKKSLKDSICKSVYKHLNSLVENCPNNPTIKRMMMELRKRPWLFIEGRFVSSKVVAFSWKGIGAPYLYGLPNEYHRKYDKLLRVAGVKEFFQASDFINALNILSESRKGARLDEEEIKLTVAFANELKDVENDVVKKHIGKIPLPDKNGVLCKSAELTINEAFWLKDRGNDRYVHSDITPNLAKALGAKLNLDRRRKKYASSFRKTFGQHEELTVRLKNILKSYPCDSGILKELVQNADDAKATEIHFVYDTRTLEHERVVQENAQEIQGPALCVYNDRYFSDEDLEGIQKLGTGSKSDDPEKTGQYGIGLNAVYHLTDCPSLLSNDDTLCILDPHCRYAPEATPEAPGAQFSPIDDAFKDDFSDSVRGYLGEHFSLKGSTMFRLPLRTAQQHLTSKISDEAFGDSEMRSLLKKFKVEAKKMLLFLNHVQKISLSEIDENGEFKYDYEVKSTVEKESETKRQEIASHAHDYKDKPTSEVPWKGTTYPVTLEDSDGLVEQWLIHQCCGVKHQTDNFDIPDGRELGLFPRGGVAALVSSSASTEQEYVAYCFLPLPVTISLPVHVNGHFALDTSRRDLWKDTDQGSRLAKWNDFMKSHVLAAGYAALIEEARNYIPHSNPAERWFFKNEREAKVGLVWYHSIFPNPIGGDPAWEILTLEVYRCLDRDKALVLPVVVHDETEELTLDVQKSTREMRSDTGPTSQRMKTRSSEAAQTTSQEGVQTRLRLASPKTKGTRIQTPSSFQRTPVKDRKLTTKDNHAESAREARLNRTKEGRLSAVSHRRRVHSTKPLARIREWLPVDKAIFTEEYMRGSCLRLLTVLLRVHMPLLLYSPLFIHHALSIAGALSRLLNPQSVIEFLLTSQEENPECKIGKLPMDLEDSTIGRECDLQEVIVYCKREKQFPYMLEGLPLLLTADGQLRVFDAKNAVYRSTFSDLFPDKARMFVDPGLVPVLRDVSVRETTEKPLPRVMLNLTVDSLANVFLPDVFEGRLELGRTQHVPWAFPEDGVLSETWFKRLWEFLGKEAEPNRRVFLHTLEDWPIIPTTQGKLVTVGNAKSVLDTTKSETEDAQVNRILEILASMNCPSLCKDITESFREEFDTTSILDHYVSHPSSVSDVLHVLDYMRRSAILKTTELVDQDIRCLLCFCQNDLTFRSVGILKSLPFFKAVDGTYQALFSYNSCVLVPAGLPTGEMNKIQQKFGKMCLFLHPDAFLNRLYKALDVRTDCSIPDFYVKYILPEFTTFSRKCQLEFLTHIRDSILLTMEKDLLRNLQSTRCIPDNFGTLQYASYFFDPRQKLFKVMLAPNQFPPFPFKDDSWLNFLVEIGLKKKCDGEQFLKFCRDVESSGAAVQSEEDEINKERSKVLVRYLFGNAHLRDSCYYLTSVSQIKFIVPEKVEEDRSSLHKQHDCDEKVQYVQFRDAVPWQHRDLVWTSAQLLPEWVQPNSKLASSLGIQEEPSVETVITHSETISRSASKKLKSGEDMPVALQKIFVSIYDFFQRTQGCVDKELSESCTSKCRMIGDRLKSVPCILLIDEKRLLKGEQLSFKVHQEQLLKPYFYLVPRDYGAFQHFLKRLGASEEVTSFQMANVLKAIKEICVDKRMCPANEEKAHHVTFLLFDSLVREDNAPKLSHLEELYLPSQDKLLVKSSELVCNVPPRLTQPVSKLQYHILYSLEECGLQRARKDEYLEALPEHLRPRPLKTLVREELDPSCRNETCIYCQGKCPFIERYILILRSTHFRLGILRLIKHQKKSEKLESDDKEKAARLGSSKVTIKCMKTIKSHLVDVKTQKALEESTCERTCYVVNEHESWVLYIQHEFGGNKTQAILSKAVNEIMDGCVEDKYIAELTDMLSCDLPSQIPRVLNEHDIPHDFPEEDEELGCAVPEVYHYLMQQNPLCTFEEAARVAYGVDQDDVTEDEEDGNVTKYTLAKIIRCSSQSGQDGVGYNFEAEYLIDLGSKSEVETVSVLDLYKYREDKTGSPMTDEDVNSSALPVDVDEEKRNMSAALLAAWKLPLLKRHKVIRRLYLHWLRSTDSKVATEMTDFLKSEVTRLESETDSTDGPGCFGGSGSFFRRWGRRGRREKQTFNNYDSMSHETHGFYGTSGYTIPDPNEAARWMKQSRADLEVTRLLHWNCHHSQVCFLSEQVVEKCLKAALYAKCGLSREQHYTHDVYRLACDVQRLNGAPKEELSRAVSVANYYLPTRYPDNQPRYKVPAEEYSNEQAKKALEVAGEVLQSIEKFVSDKDL